MKVIEPIIICRNLFSENKTIMAAKNGIVAITKPILGNKIRYKIKLIKAITVDLVLRGSSWNSSLFSTVFIVKIELINNEIDKDPNLDVSITFDDGYENIYRFAFDYLNESRIKKKII